jgi:hypothetical protein
MAPLNVCGKLLSPEDRNLWLQAIATLIGLKRRNSFGEEDLAAAVGKALHRGASSRTCEDCGAKVASGAAYSGGPQASERSPCFGDSYTRPAPNVHRISCKPPWYVMR